MSFQMAPLNTFDFGTTDRLHFDARPYVFLEGLPAGGLFKDMDGSGRVEYITHDRIAEMMGDRKRYRIERSYFSAAHQTLVARGDNVLLSDLDEDERASVLRKYGLVQAYRRLLAPYNNPSDEQRNEAIDAIQADYLERVANVRKRVEVKRIWRRPSLSSVKKWDAQLANGNEQAIALRDGRWRSGNRTERFAKAALELIEQGIRGWLDERRPTICDQFSQVQSLFYFANKERVAKGWPLLKAPCKSAFYARFKKLDKFYVKAMRYGVEVAEKEFRSTGDGLNVVRPGRRSEIDGWTVELQTLLSDADEWKELTKEERAKTKTIRLTVIVVMDVATRCVTGINFCFHENANAAIGATRLAVENKDKLATASGCKSTWPMYSAGTLAGDTGAAFMDEEFSAIALDAFGGLQRAVVGVPYLRACIERFFKTMARQLLSHFTGRTFGNVIEKEEYDAEARASIDFETLRAALIRYVVDVYHHTHHEELGMSPFAAWHYLGSKSPPPPPMDRGRIAAIFGIRRMRHVRGEGVQVFCQHYNSETLQQAMRNLGIGTELRIKIDPDDLGEIAVEVPYDEQDEMGILPAPGQMCWISVPGPEECQTALKIDPGSACNIDPLTAMS